MKASNGIDVDRRLLSFSLMVVAAIIASLSSFLWLPSPSWSSDQFRAPISSSSDLPSLHSAALKGQEQTVKKLLSQGADVNGRDSNGNTVLMYAALRGHTQIVDLLLVNGADVNAQNAIGATALYDASFQGYTEIVQRLLRKGARVDLAKSDGVTALIPAAALGNPPLVQALLKAGADPNRSAANGETALLIAASSGNNDVVQLLIVSGAKVNHQNVQGETALIKAVETPGGKRGNYLDIVKTLLAAGANPNLKIKEANELMKYAGLRDGDTALSIARRWRNLEMIRILEQAGATAA